MAMREECKNFQSRTYASGEAARFCVLGLAPEAPWRCPDDCAKYEPRLADVAWVHGSLIPRKVESEPDDIGAEEIRALMESASEIVADEVTKVAEDPHRKGIRPFWKRRG